MFEVVVGEFGALLEIVQVLMNEGGFSFSVFEACAHVGEEFDCFGGKLNELQRYADSTNDLKSDGHRRYIRSERNDGGYLSEMNATVKDKIVRELQVTK